MERYRALRIYAERDKTRAEIEQMPLEAPAPGEVLIEAHYSGINYKDALAVTGRGKILRRSPLTGGIDVSGIVIESQSDAFRPGDPVLVTGGGIGERTDGGLAEYVKVAADGVIPLPSALGLKEAMIIGTAGFTAALALHRMEENQQRPEHGPIVVTGASGGVGSLALDIFSTRGYEVVAITGKPDQVETLHQLGARKVLLREEIDTRHRPLESACWGGAVDMVGGETLGWLTATTREWGNIAAIGLAESPDFNGSVMPFILRGVSLLGITAANCPPMLRRKVWNRLGHDLIPQHLPLVHDRTIALEEVKTYCEAMLARRTRGRTVVAIKGEAR